MPAQMSAAAPAQGNLPLITGKPAVTAKGLSGGQAPAGLAKAADQESYFLRIGEPMKMMVAHLGTLRFPGDWMVTGAAANGGVVFFSR